MIPTQSQAGPSRGVSASIVHTSSERSRSYRGRSKGNTRRTRDESVETDSSLEEDCTTLASSSSSSSLRTDRRVGHEAQRSPWSMSSTSSVSPSSSFLLFLTTIALALAMLSQAPLSAQAQLVAAGEQNNVTSLEGTWSTGSGKVTTGIGFYNPVNTTFTVPTSAGQSYSFTNDGYWEQAIYTYADNGAKPSCVSAQLIWQHGTYTINANNSLTLTPFNGDGRQVVEDRCSSTSTTSVYYYQPEYMLGWDIVLDTHFGSPGYRLQLYQFDGALKPLMWQVYDPPQMLSKELLVETIYGSTDIDTTD